VLPDYFPPLFDFDLEVVLFLFDELFLLLFEDLFTLLDEFFLPADPVLFLELFLLDFLGDGVFFLLYLLLLFFLEEVVLFPLPLFEFLLGELVFFLPLDLLGDFPPLDDLSLLEDFLSALLSFFKTLPTIDFNSFLPELFELSAL